MKNTFVVVGATLVNQSKIDQPVQAPAYGGRSAELEQEQALDRQRAPLLLEISNFDKQRVIDRGYKTREMFLRECLQPSKGLKHATD